jgi:predicted phage terminase large subunit-like protein
MKITTGSSYENRTNLADSFFQQIIQYEGTTLGRQEIHAEVIDLEDQGIIKRSWFKLWKYGRDLPHFTYIIQSYDTAFTEKTHNDPTACTVWGIFENDEGTFCAMLLDAWCDHLQYPELRRRVADEFTAKYGGEDDNPMKPGQSADLVLVEEKGSGITLIQDLSRTHVPVRAYNPGRMDKVQRLHAVSHLACNGRVYIPESGKVQGEPCTWATDFISEICVFPLSLHDDYTDTFSQAMSLFRDQNWLSVDPIEEEDFYYDDEHPRKKRENPYAV